MSRFPPRTQALESGALSDTEALGFTGTVRLADVYLHRPIEALKSRIEERGNPRDASKLKNWDTYARRLTTPTGLAERGVHVVPCDQAPEHLLVHPETIVGQACHVVRTPLDE